MVGEVIMNEKIILSKDQKIVFDFIIDKIKSGEPIATFGGYAGTGKSTLITKIISELRKENKNYNFSFLSFTGKAANILKSKLIFESRINKNGYKQDVDFIGTIHSFMYKAKTTYDNELKKYVITGWKKKTKSEIGPYSLIIIDEASMLPNYILNDLKTYEIQILAVGDHGQLPPVTKDPDKTNIIQHPDIKLIKIHRQCENSPIIKLSQFVRDHGHIPNNTVFDKSVFKIDWNHNKCQEIWNNELSFDKDMVCLCGFNYSRVVINEMIRNKFKFKENFPYSDERIICLKNDHKLGIMNGQMATLMWSIGISKKFMKVTIDLDDDMVDGYVDCVSSLTTYNQEYHDIYNIQYTKKDKRILKEQGFKDVNYFDYGYCISIHKSQGGSWDMVVLFEQRGRNWSDEYYAKWLYTGITRAKNKLMIISNYR